MDLSGLDNLINVYKNLDNTILQSADTAMVVSSAELVELNKLQLRDYGKDSEGQKLRFAYPRKTKIAGAYTKPYKRFKENKYGGQTSFVDLTLSGELLNSLRLDHVTLGLFVFVSDSNADLLDILTRSYTPDIVGVQDKNLKEFAIENMKQSIEQDIEKLFSQL